jgi:hypothetical protein
MARRRTGLLLATTALLVGCVDTDGLTGGSTATGGAQLDGAADSSADAVANAETSTDVASTDASADVDVIDGSVATLVCRGAIVADACQYCVCQACELLSATYDSCFAQPKCAAIVECAAKAGCDLTADCYRLGDGGKGPCGAVIDASDGDQGSPMGAAKLISTCTTGCVSACVG